MQILPTQKTPPICLILQQISAISFKTEHNSDQIRSIPLSQSPLTTKLPYHLISASSQQLVQMIPNKATQQKSLTSTCSSMGCSGDYKSLEKSTVFEVLREDGYSLSAMLYCVTNIPEIVRMVDLVTNHEADEETRQKINRLVQVMEVKGEERWREWMGFRETLGKVEVSPVKDSINWNNPTTITPKPSNLLDSKIAQALNRTISQPTWHSHPLKLYFQQQLTSHLHTFFQLSAIQFCLHLCYQPSVNTNILLSQSFSYGEQIHQSESQTLEFKNYKYPFEDPKIAYILKKTACGFLNMDGGVVFVGVNERLKNMTRWVEGLHLGEGEMGEVKEFFKREVFGQIHPKVQEEGGFKVRFLKVRKLIIESGKDLYVVRIDVMRGSPNELYHFYEKSPTGKPILGVYLRNHSELQQIKSLEDIQKEMRRRILGRNQYR